MHQRSDDVPSAEAVLVEGTPHKRTCEMADAAYISQVVAAILCMSLGVLLSILMAVYGVGNVMRIIISMLPESPTLSFAVLMCLVTMFSIVVILPIWPPMCMLNGLVFGIVTGSVLNFIAIFGAAFISLLLGRSMCQEPIRSCIFDGDYPTFRRVLTVLEDNENTIKFLLLFRFLFIPMFIRNYGPAVLEVPLWKILISVVPHAIWISLLFASLGSSFQDAAQLLRKGKELSAKSFKWQQALIVGAGFLFTMVLTYYAHNKYMEKLDEESSEPLSRRPAREVRVREAAVSSQA
mmetsp:Transcript_151332/g.263800  ORF Transcript_151332/g.263800 Transcript_151332/m.263800 type:complete len:293 (-) Transcript_151332:76-954(-)